MGTENTTTERMKIVVGIDFSETSDQALRVAVNLARSSGMAEVHLVNVLAPPVGGTELAPLIDVSEQTAIARRQIAVSLDSLAGVPGVFAFSHVLVGNPQKELPRIADELEADLIVVGTHGRRGVDRMVFGSVAEHVVRTAPCSVLTVRPRPPTAASTIEPACAECAAVVAKTEGRELRCASHARHSARAHTYSEMPQGFGLGWMTFRS